MKKLLIVDDALFMRMSIKSMLQDLDIEIVGEAADGMEAIEQCKLLNPDIITLDITMPVMSGLQALEEIKKVCPASKVIMVSALGNGDMVKQAIIMGATTFIVKPFEKDILIKVIQTVM